MTVKQLIAKLRKMPQNLDVGVAAHDNAEWEIGGWPHSVQHFVKSECTLAGYQDEMWDTTPDECVVLRC